MRFCSLLAASAAVLFLNGCAGYRLGSTVPLSMEGVKTVAVPTFENDTLVPRLEVLAANSVIKQLQQDGTFTVEGEETADVSIDGRITQVRRRGSRSVRGDVLASREYTLTVTFDYTVTKRTTGEVLDKGSVTGNTSFFVSGNDVNQDERQAIPLALEDAAVQLVSRVCEGW
jgi:outer membrane lipopolysaccharide assembly protein LptE/RlpB